MDSKERKIKSVIAEGIQLSYESKLKATNNPYAALNTYLPSIQELNTESTIIYDHMKRMGVL